MALTGLGGGSDHLLVEAPADLPVQVVLSPEDHRGVAGVCQVSPGDWIRFPKADFVCSWLSSAGCPGFVNGAPHRSI